MFRSAVPAVDESRRIQHINCIISDALNQQAKSFLAATQCLSGVTLFADVQSYADHAEGLILIVAVCSPLAHHPTSLTVLAKDPVLRLQFSAGTKCLANGKPHGQLILGMDQRNCTYQVKPVLAWLEAKNFKMLSGPHNLVRTGIPVPHPKTGSLLGQPKLFFAILQCLLQLLAPFNLAHQIVVDIPQLPGSLL